jgi:hypothetical protein
MPKTVQTKAPEHDGWVFDFNARQALNVGAFATGCY